MCLLCSGEGGGGRRAAGIACAAIFEAGRAARRARRAAPSQLVVLLREVRPDGAPEAVNLTLHDGEGRQALHLLAENGHAECVRMLVMAGGAAHANARVAGGEQGHALKLLAAIQDNAGVGGLKKVRRASQVVRGEAA